MMKIHCEDPWFSKIKHGEKTVEGRKRDGKFEGLKAGEIVEFYLDDESFTVRVTKIFIYKTLREYLETETLEKTLPGISTIDEGISIYHKWYSDEDIERAGGFIAIHLIVDLP